MTKTKQPKTFASTRRGFLKTLAAGGAAAGAAIGAPYLWIPKAHAATSGFDTAKHFIYIRLSGGFRFTTAFNCDVSSEFSPWGTASSVASGTEWGPGDLLSRSDWLSDELSGLGMKKVTDFTNEIAVIPCVDHEPLAGSADGNHLTGLERFLTGYVNGSTGIFTMINYGLRAKVEAAAAEGNVLLPAIIMGQPGMGRGSGEYAAYRPPVLRGDDLERFGFNTDALLPEWAREMTQDYDARFRDRQQSPHFSTVDAYLQSREATKAYSEIFSSDALKIENGSDEVIDGVSNAQLATAFGQSSASRNLRLALRLFSFGCPAIYLDQGGYDLHSGEEEGLPGRMAELNRLLSALHWALKTMQHPSGGTYWDHTIVSLGSEFSRSSRGGRFNSARGSDHGGDYATRWMAMPFFGGPIQALGRRIGETRAEDLEPLGTVVSYRATMKTVMDALGCDHDVFFPADQPFDDLFIA
ncbi:DUF1501 domain-containing protein [Pseudenhygromyxa sp. WMMC2535]|uniref:DUF1501 domain-containing protein n=1 Tax=Pseudenhygromyxa sp. WMMC2535 TaxID=2712867 RepID=UPI001556FAD9|nr:DUF1501 domain-containing protein [Pseudenhygromyxa sp. WMMC2535]NVB39403.1 DUF1501 domain-containing protein [Pseudenhygromyxa sp. WMMC2535]